MFFIVGRFSGKEGGVALSAIGTRAVKEPRNIALHLSLAKTVCIVCKPITSAAKLTARHAEEAVATSAPVGRLVFCSCCRL